MPPTGTPSIPGPESRRLLAEAAEHEGPAVARQPSVAWSKASGVQVEDVDGNVYLDFTSGVLLANIGHGHPRLVAAIRDQATELLASYNFVNPWRVELERRLIEIGGKHGLDRVWIGSTGAEAVELALKLARYASGRSGVLALAGGYHGKTLAATAVGGRPEAMEGLGPLLPGVVQIPFPRADGPPDEERRAREALERIDLRLNPIGAVIIEVLQGNAGQREPTPGFLSALQAWTRKEAAVLIVDEVQSAFGRTGTLFAFEQAGLRPDLLIAGKGISSSLPLTVLIGRKEVFDAAPERTLSSTHGGNPVCCRAACVVLDVLREEGLLDNAREVGSYLMAELSHAFTRAGVPAEVRGTGLMIGVEILEPGGRPAPELAFAIVEAAIAQGLMLLAPIGLSKNVIRVSPPLVINREQAKQGIEILERAAREAVA